MSTDERYDEDTVQRVGAWVPLDPPSARLGVARHILDHLADAGVAATARRREDHTRRPLEPAPRLPVRVRRPQRGMSVAYRRLVRGDALAGWFTAHRTLDGGTR